MATQGKLYSSEEATAIIFQGLYVNDSANIQGFPKERNPLSMA